MTWRHTGNPLRCFIQCEKPSTPDAEEVEMGEQRALGYDALLRYHDRDYRSTIPHRPVPLPRTAR